MATTSPTSQPVAQRTTKKEPQRFNVSGRLVTSIQTTIGTAEAVMLSQIIDTYGRRYAESEAESEFCRQFLAAMEYAE